MMVRNRQSVHLAMRDDTCTDRSVLRSSVVILILGFNLFSQRNIKNSSVYTMKWANSYSGRNGWF